MRPSDRAHPARTVTLLALCAALVFGLQVVMAPLPNIEPVTILMLLYTLYFRWRALYIIYAFAVLELLVYGFNVWWIVYLYIWTVFWAVAMPLGRRARPAWFWAFVTGLYGLVFGALCSPPDFLVGGWPLALTKWISGIPFDLIHGAANFALTLVLFAPLDRLFSSLRARGMLL